MSGDLYAHGSSGGGGSGDVDTEVLADNPVGYWKLDESSGTTKADSSGNGNDGTYVNTPTLGTRA